jgi:hypothetical protein
MIRSIRMLAMSVAMSGAIVGLAAAQTPAKDPSARLKEVLPSDVAARVLAKIADARAHELPAAALENRVLKNAAKGVAPNDIEKSVDDQVEHMKVAKDALQKGRETKPTDDEVDAGAEVIRRGVDGAKVSALAKSAPSGRSLAVPLYVIGSLMDRGLPSDEALKRVNDKLAARATDSDLEGLPDQAKGEGSKPAVTGRDLAATKRPAAAGAGASNGRGAGGPPAGVPANGGKGATAPGRGKKPPLG